MSLLPVLPNGLKSPCVAVDITDYELEIWFMMSRRACEFSQLYYVALLRTSSDKHSIINVQFTNIILAFPSGLY